MRIRTENLKAYLDNQKGAATRIAKALGCNKSLVANWKSGRELVPESHTITIAKVLGRSVSDLCDPLLNFHPGLPDTAETRMIAQLLPRLTPLNRERVLSLALQLSQEQIQNPDLS